MNIISRVENNIQYLEINEPLSIYQSAEIKATLLSLDWQHQIVKFDLSHVDEIDSAGVQLLLMSAKAAREYRLSPIEITHSSKTREIFDLLHLDHHFDWHDPNTSEHGSIVQ
mgnify:FL=1